MSAPAMRGVGRECVVPLFIIDPYSAGPVSWFTAWDSACLAAFGLPKRC